MVNVAAVTELELEQNTNVHVLSSETKPTVQQECASHSQLHTG